MKTYKSRRLIMTPMTVILVLAALFTVSCSKKDGAEDLIIAKDGASEYSVIYAEDASKNARESAMDIALAIQQSSGAELTVTDDTAKESEYEILVGDTNREETAKAKEMIGENDYIIAAVNKKLVIYSSLDTYYKTALSYIKNTLAKGSEFTVKSDYCYTGNKITTFIADEKVSGKTVVDITVTPESAQTQPGLFVGKEYEKGMFGYQGYCFIVTKNKMTLYKFNDELDVMVSKQFYGIKSGESITLRMELEDRVCRAYVLDDAEGYEPWPEFELEVKNCKDYSIGYLEMSGQGALYDDFTVTYDNSEKPANTYTNTIYDGYADPDVLYHNGTYYLYATGGNGYIVHTSKDLVNWKKGGTAVQPNLWGITKNYWAPDVEYINGKFYMVVSCNENLGIAVSDSPEGPFVATTENVLYNKTIDGHLFVDDDGKVYLYYVSWRSAYGIYGVELDDNMQPIARTERCLITPTENWEKQQSGVTEGPFMLKHNGIYYLTYSGSHYESIDYAVGYATSDKPLGTYTKYEYNPIMIGNTQIHGVGHHCITTTPDGKEMIIVYHCHNSLTQVQTRKLCIDRIRFSPVEGQMDRLEVYGPTVTPQPYPIKEEW